MRIPKRDAVRNSGEVSSDRTTLGGNSMLVVLWLKLAMIYFCEAHVDIRSATRGTEEAP
jgi:hypothetical protein